MRNALLVMLLVSVVFTEQAYCDGLRPSPILAIARIEDGIAALTEGDSVVVITRTTLRLDARNIKGNKLNAAVSETVAPRIKLENVIAFDMNRRQIEPAALKILLAKSRPVILSTDGRLPDEQYLNLFNKEAVILALDQQAMEVMLGFAPRIQVFHSSAGDRLQSLYDQGLISASALERARRTSSRENNDDAPKPSAASN